jgi:ABC-type uncharacterized transport system permease subunit
MRSERHIWLATLVMFMLCVASYIRLTVLHHGPAAYKQETLAAQPTMVSAFGIRIVGSEAFAASIDEALRAIERYGSADTIKTVRYIKQVVETAEQGRGLAYVYKGGNTAYIRTQGVAARTAISLAMILAHEGMHLRQDHEGQAAWSEAQQHVRCFKAEEQVLAELPASRFGAARVSYWPRR